MPGGGWTRVARRSWQRTTYRTRRAVNACAPRPSTDAMAPRRRGRRSTTRPGPRLSEAARRRHRRMARCCMDGHQKRPQVRRGLRRGRRRQLPRLHRTAAPQDAGTAGPTRIPRDRTPRRCTPGHPTRMMGHDGSTSGARTRDTSAATRATTRHRTVGHRAPARSDEGRGAGKPRRHLTIHVRWARMAHFVWQP